MKKNMGIADRIIRLGVAALLLILWFTSVLSGTSGVIALVIAGIFSLTAAIGFCPLYTLFGLKTCPAESGK